MEVLLYMSMFIYGNMRKYYSRETNDYNAFKDYHWLNSFVKIKSGYKNLLQREELLYSSEIYTYSRPKQAQKSST